MLWNSICKFGRTRLKRRCLAVMKIVEFITKPIGEIAFLNAGRRPNQFYQDRGKLSQTPTNGWSVLVETMILSAIVIDRSAERMRFFLMETVE